MSKIKVALDMYEEQLILASLERNAWNALKAAREAKEPYTTFRRRILKFKKVAKLWNKNHPENRYG